MGWRCLLLLPVCVWPENAWTQAPRFSSADAADAAERATGRRSHMAAEIRLLAGNHLRGPAVTMRIVRDDSASLMDEGLKAIKVVEEAAAGSVIVACLDAEKDFAVFGATFVTLAKSRRLGGFVIDGAVRGVKDLRRIAVPVFARGSVAGSAGGHYRLAAVNDTVSCGGTTVAPGDIVVGDDDGIAIVPAGQAGAIFAKAAALREEKVAMLSLIAKHGSYTKAVAEHRAQHAKKTAGPRRP